MSVFAGLLSPQYHKSRSGYYINHDLLMSVSEATRKKLIFYFIAEQTPGKLSAEDAQKYQCEQIWRVRAPITLTTYITFFGVFAASMRGRKPLWAFSCLTVAGLTAALTNQALWRAYEGRMLESSVLVDDLMEKYNFGIFDFSVAKKQAHIKNILAAYDMRADADGTPTL